MRHPVRRRGHPALASGWLAQVALDVPRWLPDGRPGRAGMRKIFQMIASLVMRKNSPKSRQPIPADMRKNFSEDCQFCGDNHGKYINVGGGSRWCKVCGTQWLGTWICQWPRWDRRGGPGMVPNGFAQVDDGEPV